MSRRAGLGLLLLLAAIAAFRADASRTSVWESNPHAAVDLTKTEAASALAPLAPSHNVEIIATEPPRFDFGAVVLVERELEHEERFGLGPLDLLGPTPLRGPPPSYPETRVRGFELLPPFRVGASPRLSLWPRQPCGSISCGLASDGPEDPWGLRALNDEDKGRIRGFNDQARTLRGLLASGSKNKKEIDEALDEIEKMRHSFVEAVRAAREDQPILAQQAPASLLDPRQVTRYGPQPSTQEVEDRNRDAYKWKFWTVDVPTTVTTIAMPHVMNTGPRMVDAYQQARPSRPEVADKRPRFWKQTVEDALAGAPVGPDGGKVCPTCSVPIGRGQINRGGQVRRDFDLDHYGRTWAERIESMPDYVTRREVIIEYNQDVRAQCPTCNQEGPPSGRAP